MLTSYYYAIFFTVALVVLGAGYLFVDKRRMLTKKFFIALGSIILITAAINIPLAKPYFDLAEMGLTRSVEITDAFKLEFSDLLVASPDNWLYGEFGESFRGDNWSEHTAFPGLLAVGLAIIALITSEKRRKKGRHNKNATLDWERAYIYALLLIVTFILAMGASYIIPYTEISIPLPFGWLFEYVPGFKALRTPARFIIITMLALAVLSGYGVAYLQMQWRGTQSSRLMFSVALIVFISAEYLSIPIPLTAYVPPETPEVYTWLAQTDEDSVLIELPFPITDEGNFDYTSWPFREGWRIYYATKHWRPMVNGYSGFLPTGQEQVLTDMLYFPDEQSISHLNEIGVRYVVVHTDQFDERQKHHFEKYIAQYTADLHQVAVFGDDLVFETTLQGGESVRQLLHECSFDNKMKLIGFSLDRTTIGSGDSMTLSLLWQNLDEMTEDYTIFVHLVDEDGRLLTQYDAQPEDKLTSTWLHNEVVRTHYTLTIPPDTPSSNAYLTIGLYVWPSLERTPVICQQIIKDDTLTLIELAIQSP